MKMERIPENCNVQTTDQSFEEWMEKNAKHLAIVVGKMKKEPRDKLERMLRSMMIESMKMQSVEHNQGANLALLTGFGFLYLVEKVWLDEA